MEWIYEMLGEIVFAAVSVVLTAVAAKLGNVMGRFWKEQMVDETLQSVARTCVSAVEMMFREKKGEEKLSEAFKMATDMLSEKGMKVSEEKLRILLEAALAEYKGAFAEV